MTSRKSLSTDADLAAPGADVQTTPVRNSESTFTLNPTLTDGHRIPIPSDATLEFIYDSPSRARIVAESVAREIGEIDDDRSRTTITREGDCVVFEIRARDLTALRAALNTWFSLVSVAEDVAKLGDRLETTR